MLISLHNVKTPIEDRLATFLLTYYSEVQKQGMQDRKKCSLKQLRND